MFHVFVSFGLYSSRKPAKNWVENTFCTILDAKLCLEILDFWAPFWILGGMLRTHQCHENPLFHFPYHASFYVIIYFIYQRSPSPSLPCWFRFSWSLDGAPRIVALPPIFNFVFMCIPLISRVFCDPWAFWAQGPPGSDGIEFWAFAGWNSHPLGKPFGHPKSPKSGNMCKKAVSRKQCRRNVLSELARNSPMCDP